MSVTAWHRFTEWMSEPMVHQRVGRAVRALAIATAGLVLLLQLLQLVRWDAGR